MGNQVKTTHGAIFEYWKDRAISEDGHIYYDYGHPKCDEHLLKKVKSIAAIYDWGEPCCMACHLYVDIQNPNYEKDLQELNLKSIWNYPDVKRTLNRCHIIPRSLGGKDEPSNLVLLCERCHKESPDTVYPQMMLMWIYQRNQKPRHDVMIQQEVNRILKEHFNIPFAAYSDKVYDPENFKNKVGTHAGSISDSSLISYYVSDVLENIKNLQLPKEKNNNKDYVNAKTSI